MVFAGITVILALGLTEGVSWVLYTHYGDELPPAGDLKQYLKDLPRRVAFAGNLYFTGNPLPGIKAPRVVLRVEDRSEGSQEYDGPGGFVRLVKPQDLPGTKQVLVFGGSAAYGDHAKYKNVFSYRLERALQKKLQDPGWRVLNLGRPGSSTACRCSWTV